MNLRISDLLSRQCCLQPWRKLYNTAWISVIWLAVMALEVSSYPPPVAKADPEWCSMGMQIVEERQCCDGYPGNFVKVFPHDQKLVKFLNDTRYAMDVQWSFELIPDKPAARDDILVIFIHESYKTCLHVAIRPAVFGGDDRVFTRSTFQCDLRRSAAEVLLETVPNFRAGKPPQCRELLRMIDRLTARMDGHRKLMILSACESSTCCRTLSQGWSVERGNHEYQFHHQMLHDPVYYFTADLNGQPLKLEHWIRPRVSCSLHSVSNGQRVNKLCHGTTDTPEPC